MGSRSKVVVDRISDECFQAITTSKENDLKLLGSKLIDKAIGPKVCWNIYFFYFFLCIVFVQGRLQPTQSQLIRGLDTRLRHIQHWTENRTS